MGLFSVGFVMQVAGPSWCRRGSSDLRRLDRDRTGARRPEDVRQRGTAMMMMRSATLQGSRWAGDLAGGSYDGADRGRGDVAVSRTMRHLVDSSTDGVVSSWSRRGRGGFAHLVYVINLHGIMVEAERRDLDLEIATSTIVVLATTFDSTAPRSSRWHLRWYTARSRAQRRGVILRRRSSNRRRRSAEKVSAEVRHLRGCIGRRSS